MIQVMIRKKEKRIAKLGNNCAPKRRSFVELERTKGGGGVDFESIIDNETVSRRH